MNEHVKVRDTNASAANRRVNPTSGSLADRLEHKLEVRDGENIE